MSVHEKPIFLALNFAHETYVSVWKYIDGSLVMPSQITLEFACHHYLPQTPFTWHETEIFS